MALKKEFTAVMQDAGGGGVFVRVPFDVEKVFGKKRVKVAATIDGEPYRGSLVRMGEPCHILGVLKGIRTKIGKGVGDRVRITVVEDAEPRVVEVPADLKAALAKQPKVRALFEKLAYTHQREYVQWIDEAKRDETRARRIAKTLEMVESGRKEP